MQKIKPIPLFWWSESRLMGKKEENYGDLLSKYLIEKISGKTVKWVQPKKQPWYKLDKLNYLGVGSIIHHATRDSVVWGSGIIDKKQAIENADFRAVRGPETRKLLLGLGYQCPEVYGDPVLLLPLYYHPKVEKKYRMGIVPHYVDFKEIKIFFKNKPEIKVIDLMTNDVERTTREILECENILSTSLHGGIVAHAYGIPAVFAKIGNRLYGNGVKFTDYVTAVGIEDYRLPLLKRQVDVLLQSRDNLIDTKRLSVIQNELLKSCPFSN